MDSDTRLSLASLTATRLAFGLQQVCIARYLFRYAAGLGGRIWFLSLIDFSLLHLHHPSHERVSSSPFLLTIYHVQHTACHDFTQYIPTHIELLEAVTTVASVAWCQRHAARLCSHPWMEPFKHLRKPSLTSKPHHLISHRQCRSKHLRLHLPADLGQRFTARIFTTSPLCHCREASRSIHDLVVVHTSTLVHVATPPQLWAISLIPPISFENMLNLACHSATCYHMHHEARYAQSCHYPAPRHCEP